MSDFIMTPIADSQQMTFANLRATGHYPRNPEALQVWRFYHNWRNATDGNRLRNRFIVPDASIMDIRN